MSAFAYLAAFVFGLSIALGALLFLVIAQLTNARWFVVFRRVAEAAAATMPLFVLLFIPIALSLPALYPWARGAPTLSPHDAEWVAHPRAWNAPLFFVARSVGYIAVWSTLALLLRRSSVALDASPPQAERARRLDRRRRALSAAGLPILAITLTLAAFDWIMPLHVDWVSDVLGIDFFAAAFAGAMGAITCASYGVWRAGLLPKEVGAAHFHALGRVVLVSVIFWAYIGISQFLLMWMADLPQEITFYAARSGHGWTAVSALLVTLHFVVPFLALLPRRLKERPPRLAAVAALLVVAHAVDMYWLVVPPSGAAPRLLDVLPFVGIGALLFGVARVFFRAASPYPLRDPALPHSLRYGSP